MHLFQREQRDVPNASQQNNSRRLPNHVPMDEIILLFHKETKCRGYVPPLLPTDEYSIASKTSLLQCIERSEELIHTYLSFTYKGFYLTTKLFNTRFKFCGRSASLLIKYPYQSCPNGT
jgi:hypothetical protein